MLGEAMRTGWVADPLALAVLGAVVVVIRGRRVGGQQAAGTARGDGWLLAGGAVATLALVSPVAGLSAELLSAHMVQHLLLLVVAAPLVAAGDPGPAALAALPPRLRRGAVVAWQAMPGSVRRPGGAVVAGGVATAAAVWVWHAPGLYGAAVDHWWLHLAEHASFLVPATVLWAGVVRRRARHRRRLLLTTLTAAGLVIQGGVLSAILTFAPEPLYAVYDATGRWGMSGLEDQQLAGMLLWAVGGPAFALAGVLALVQGLDAADDLVPTPPRAP